MFFTSSSFLRRPKQNHGKSCRDLPYILIYSKYYFSNRPFTKFPIYILLSRWILNPNPFVTQFERNYWRGTRRCGCGNGWYTHGTTKADWWSLRSRRRNGTGEGLNSWVACLLSVHLSCAGPATFAFLLLFGFCGDFLCKISYVS